MSRTDSHRPRWVALNDPALVEERHDHRTGPCDLPPVVEYFTLVRDHGEYALWKSRRCAYDVPWWRLPPTCGCVMCRGDRVAERRAERHASKRLLAHHVGRIADA